MNDRFFIIELDRKEAAGAATVVFGVWLRRLAAWRTGDIGRGLNIVLTGFRGACGDGIGRTGDFETLARERELAAGAAAPAASADKSAADSAS